MSRYIDADNMKSIKNIQSANFNSIESIREWVDAQPTAAVRENVKGRWLDMERIEESEANVITEWQQARCSVCGKWHTTPYMYFFTHYNFCPNCGAQMVR